MPSTALYRPLEAANGTRPTSSGLRTSHSGSSKVRALWPKTANSRRLFVCVMVLMTLLVYVVWCAVINNSDESRGTFGSTTGKSAQENSYFHSTLVVDPKESSTQQPHQSPSSPQPPTSMQPHGFLMVAPLMLEKLKQRAEMRDDPPSSSSRTSANQLQPPTSGGNINARDLKNTSSE